MEKCYWSIHNGVPFVACFVNILSCVSLIVYQCSYSDLVAGRQQDIFTKCRPKGKRKLYNLVSTKHGLVAQWFVQAPSWMKVSLSHSLLPHFRNVLLSIRDQITLILHSIQNSEMMHACTGQPTERVSCWAGMSTLPTTITLVPCRPYIILIDKLLYWHAREVTTTKSIELTYMYAACPQNISFCRYITALRVGKRAQNAQKNIVGMQ